MPSPDSFFSELSLVVAITGHMDLYPEDFDRFEKEIGAIFEELRRKYPNTPILLLTGLAEGTDRIAAYAARKANPPIDYVAVLPMPEDLYREDFETDSDREFQEMLRGAVRQIVLPLRDRVTPEDLRNGGPVRDEQYARMGEFLVKYSQILIAIWDGRRNGKRGGTSEVVGMKLGEKPSLGRMAFSRMNHGGAGPVYEIAARRISSGLGILPSVRRQLVYPKAALPGDYEASYRLQDRFNADIKSAGKSFSSEKAASRRNLFEGIEAVGLTGAMEWVADIYSCADALALRFARKSLLLWKAVFILLALAGVALTWLHTLDGGLRSLAAYYGCLLSAAGIAAIEVRTQRRGRHGDYRALAEALRVQFFWMAAGLPDMAAEQYLRKQAGETVWIRDAMSECGLYDQVLERSSRGNPQEILRLTLARAWVESQKAFFLRRGRQHESKRKVLTALAYSAAVVGLVASALGFLPSIREQRESWAHAAAGVAMWLAALIWNYIERRGFAQEARQYARMYDLFHAAGQDLEEYEKQQNFEESERTIRELGREALEESGDWLSMHRERKLSPELGTG